MIVNFFNKLLYYYSGEYYYRYAENSWSSSKTDIKNQKVIENAVNSLNFNVMDNCINASIKAAQKNIQIYNDVVSNMVFPVVPEIYYPKIPILEIQNNLPILNNAIFKHIELANQVKNIINLTPQMVIPPTYLINNISLTQDALNNVYNSIGCLWDNLDYSLKQVQSLVNMPYFGFLDILDKEVLVMKLYNHVVEMGDDELESIFNKDFLRILVFSDWWIMPTISKDEFKEISNNNDLSVEFINKFLYGRSLETPELFQLMMSNWNISNVYRETIILQAFDNYLKGNFETCVILLTLQIEGILRENIKMTASNCTELRIKLENKLKNKKCNTLWESFLNKVNIEFIWMVLKPLYDSVDFGSDNIEVNRNIIAHVGIVKASQLNSMRLFFILDTLFYIFNDLNDNN